MSKECQNCYTTNIDTAAICINCKKSFNDTTPAGNKKSVKSPVLVLTHLNSGKVIEIKENCILGRSGNVEPDFFTDENKYVGEYHCKVILENDDFYIEHLPTRNPTKINNESIPKGIKMIIRDGDYLTIADRTFEVSIPDITEEEVIEEAVPEQNVKVTETNELPTETKFIITCPVCGFEYQVENIDDQINECNNCDKYDKKEISKVKAKVKHAN